MNNLKTRLAICICLLAMVSCNNKSKEDYSWIKKSIDVSVAQLDMTAREIADSAKIPRSIWAGYDAEFLCKQLEKDYSAFKDSLYLNPNSNRIGERRLADVYDWTSGFFPGSLWYAYHITGDNSMKEQATGFTNLLYPVSNYTKTHDLGFMINCSYGNAERFAPNDTIASVLIRTADNLISRFDPTIGAIRSWDFGTWNFPVIIDNMMNLDLLFYVSHLTSDNRYKDIAMIHANKTMANHFRPDYSSYHVISYNNDGTVERRQTYQGKNDESSWSRGQAWAVYGYVSCYRETKDKAYLDQAINIAKLIMNRVKTADLIPLWDYDAPDTPETPRDASAASITASAFIELSTMVEDGSKYFDYAEKILKSLSGDNYLAAIGSNQGFILKHSTGSLPNGSEIDVPLNYADYYFLEGLDRYMKLKNIEYKDL
ncbi:DUF4995 domain-containing protein [Dysgonomonas reticulitermitis]